MKRMGGTAVLAWGEMAVGARRVQGTGCDKYGRWAALEVMGGGANQQPVVVVSVYKPPGGSQRQGGLLARMLALRGWQTGTWAARVRKAHKAFYEELGDCVRKWHAEGKSVVIAGDFNEEAVEGSPLRAWGITLGLSDVYSIVGDRGGLRGESATHWGGRGGRGRRIDHVWASEQLAQGWVGSQGSMHTLCPAGIATDHRLLLVTGANWGNCSKPL